MSHEPFNDALRNAREILEESRRATGIIDARNDAQDRIAAEKPDTLLQKAKDLSLGARRIGKVAAAVHDLYEKVSPWVGPVLRPIGWTARTLKDAFVFAAYEREDGKLKLDADGDPIFSAGRLARTFGVAAMIGLAGVTAINAAYYHGTQFTETVNVTGKEQIVPGEKYQFTGCTSLPCSTTSDNGKYYQIEQSLLFPNLLYPEQDVFANIPSQGGVCEVQGYGLYFKTLKPIIKSLELYQNVYDASCRPFTAKELEAASGQAGNAPSANMELTP